MLVNINVLVRSELEFCYFDEKLPQTEALWAGLVGSEIAKGIRFNVAIN
jgi:hypothetical protein